MRRLATMSAAALLWVVAFLPPLAAQVMAGHRSRVPRVEAGLIVEGEPERRYTIAQRMEHYRVPGVGIAVMDEGQIVWAKGYGVRDVDTGEPVAAETLFQAASISKPVAALAVHRLVERGVLDLDTEVNEYLTTWKLPGSDFTAERPVTLRGILSHTAGLTQHGFPGYASNAELPTVPQILDGEGNTGAVRVDMLPGETWRYSGGGYTILQQVLVDVTGTPFPQLLRELVLDPMRVRLSTYEQPLPSRLWENAAHAHDRQGQPIDGWWHVYPELAAAGLWTTPFELLRIVSEVQRSWKGEVGTFLQRETAREMLRPLMNGYGLGFGTGEGPNARFGHGGSNNGFKALLTAYIEDGKGLAVMTNGDQGSALANEILRAVAAEYGWKEIDPG